MRTPKGWEAKAYPFTHVTEGTRTVEGVVHPCGFLGYHDNSSPGMTLYIVDHLPTGAMICQVEKQTQAQELCGLLSAMTPTLDCMSPERSTLSSALAVVSSAQQRWREEVTRKPAPVPRMPPTKEASRSSFSPHFTNRNPSKATRVAANESALALDRLWESLPGTTGGAECPGPSGTAITKLHDFYGRLDRWHDTETREVLVVKLTQKPNQVLTPSDIPSSLPLAAPRRQEGQRYYLRDGTLANAEQFKVEYQRLMEYGDRLQEGARRLLRLYTECGGDLTALSDEQRARWWKIDARFGEIVCEAWMVWSRCSYCFWASSPTFQKKVTDKIGYIGNAEQGWAELGRKTFLRHPEIKEVAPLRQEMKESR